VINERNISDSMIRECKVMRVVTGGKLRGKGTHGNGKMRRVLLPEKLGIGVRIVGRDRPGETHKNKKKKGGGKIKP